MKTLAIEREFGSGGREIGMKVAEKAGISFYDSNLIAEAANDFHISLDLLKEYDEQKSGSLLYDIAAFSNYNRNGGQQKIHELFYGMQETIKKLAMQGPCVFIGRCSTEILSQNTQSVGVYVYSSDTQKRINRIVEVEGISESEARKRMEKKDRQRKAYFKFWTEKEWTDRNNYDMELNTAKFSTDHCAEVLLKAIEA